MKPFPRLKVLFFLGAVALLATAQPPHAESGVHPLAGNSCLSRNACVVEGYRVAGILARAGRITFVKTTCALVRVLTYNSEARRDTLAMATTGGR